MKLTPFELRVFRAIAREAGLRIRVVQNLPRWNWSGKSRTIQIANSDAHELGHEIAHWLVATPDERREKEYGLDGSPFAMEPIDRPREDWQRIQAREEEASCLGIWIENTVYGTARAMETADEHNWRESDGFNPGAESKFLEFSGEFAKRGLLTLHEGRVIPTCCLGILDLLEQHA